MMKGSGDGGGGGNGGVVDGEEPMGKRSWRKRSRSMSSSTSQESKPKNDRKVDYRDNCKG